MQLNDIMQVPYIFIYRLTRESDTFLKYYYIVFDFQISLFIIMIMIIFDGMHRHALHDLKVPLNNYFYS